MRSVFMVRSYPRLGFGIISPVFLDTQTSFQDVYLENSGEVLPKFEADIGDFAGPRGYLILQGLVEVVDEKLEPRVHTKPATPTPPTRCKHRHRPSAC